MMVRKIFKIIIYKLKQYYRLSAGITIVSGSREAKEIKIWSISECECVNTIKVRTDSINCLKIYVTYPQLIKNESNYFIKLCHVIEKSNNRCWRRWNN